LNSPRTPSGATISASPFARSARMRQDSICITVLPVPKLAKQAARPISTSQRTILRWCGFSIGCRSASVTDSPAAPAMATLRRRKSA
jgi:hypothetical protein